MKDQNSTTETRKEGIKEVYNLILIDRSGSMCSIADQAVSFINETIGTIRAAQRSTDIPQRVTITSFCGCSTIDHCENTPVDNLRPVSRNEYKPCCSTPLYDAMGDSLTKLRKVVGTREDVAVSINIITDGYENASSRWNSPEIKALVELLKADGWLFAFMGANQDVLEIKRKLSIDNVMDFEASPMGTNDMSKTACEAKERWISRLKDVKSRADIDNSNYI
ncbi:MAG: hypothetical protein NC111_02985 [Bacteroides sp.]|nr:hypothetical protein [Bacteroides sp.]MCM1412815.1 hypothetical protein [Bacteroides sp.]MCM1471484.1 hypothetical protein [Bacteroides sp.]